MLAEQTIDLTGLDGTPQPVFVATMDFFCFVARLGSTAQSLVQYRLVPLLSRRVGWQQRPIEDALVRFACCCGTWCLLC